MPQTTWLSHLSFPQVAFGDYRAVTQVNTVFHEQRLMMEKGITDRFGLATNIGVAGTMSGSNGFINEGMFSFAAGYDLGNNWGMYAEYFMDWQRLVANSSTPPTSMVELPNSFPTTFSLIFMPVTTYQKPSVLDCQLPAGSSEQG